MRIQKTVLYVLFPAFLCYYVAVAHTALQKDALAGPASAFSELRRIIPRLALPTCLNDTVDLTMGSLRRAVADSWLMHDSRPSAEQSRRDFAALWADLEPVPVMVDTPTTAPSSYPVLIPGQD
jgi:hypothetical protein